MSEEAVIEEGVEPNPESVEAKRPRKLIKSTSKETMVVIIEVVGVESGPIEYPLPELNQDIVDQLALHGLSQKLGDAAAGKDGKDAEDSIAETWANLKEGKFRGERAGGERMPSKKAMASTLETLSPDEQEAARAALARLGITL